MPKFPFACSTLTEWMTSNSTFFYWWRTFYNEKSENREHKGRLWFRHAFMCEEKSVISLLILWHLLDFTIILKLSVSFVNRKCSFYRAKFFLNQGNSQNIVNNKSWRVLHWESISSQAGLAVKWVSNRSWFSVLNTECKSWIFSSKHH